MLSSFLMISSAEDEDRAVDNVVDRIDDDHMSHTY